MRKITIIGIALIAFCGSAAAQIPVDSDNRVGQPGAAPKGGVAAPRDAASGLPTGVKSPRDAASGQATGIQSPRDPASGLPTGKR